MQPDPVRRWPVLSLLLLGVACADTAAPTPRAPIGQLEPLPAVVTHRQRNPDERLPTILMYGHDGILRVSVARLALCDTQVQAGVSRAGGGFDLVAIIGSNPAALCAANNGQYVVEYQMDVPRVALGLYEVRVFEGGFTGREPRFLGQSRTWVDAPNQ